MKLERSWKITRGEGYNWRRAKIISTRNHWHKCLHKKASRLNFFNVKYYF